MKRLVKYGVVPAITFLVLLALTVMALPIVMDVQKFIPQIERQATRMTGRQVVIGSNLGLSFFPWLRVSCSDLQIGNPDGFLSDHLVRIESFEATIKLLPLLKKEVDISRFIVSGLDLNLERRADGQANWDFSKDAGNSPAARAKTYPRSAWTLPAEPALALFAVTDGAVRWIDRSRQLERRFEELLIVLKHAAADEPANFEIRATVGGRPLGAEGRLGPVRRQEGGPIMPVDLAIKLFNTIPGQLTGTLANPTTKPSYDLKLYLPAFSLKALFADVALNIPLDAEKANRLPSVSVDLLLQGSPSRAVIDQLTVKTEDGVVAGKMTIGDWLQPAIDFTLTADRFDFDRFSGIGRAPGDQTSSQTGRVSPATGAGGFWQQAQIKGALQVRQLKIADILLGEVEIGLKGGEGMLVLDTSSLDFYRGQGQAMISLDLLRAEPRTNVDMKAHGVQVGELLHDVVGASFMTGTLEADLRLLFAGADRREIVRNLYGDGRVTIKNGILAGIDLATGRSNSETVVGEGKEQAWQTEFSELSLPVVLRKGVVACDAGMVTSASGRMVISGTADLAGQQLALAVSPLAVDGGNLSAGEARAGAVPLAISGSFAKPAVEVDTRYLSAKGLALPPEFKQPAPGSGTATSSAGGQGGMTGKPLIDPSVVAQQFGLRSEEASQGQPAPAGSSRITIHPLREEERLPNRP